MVKGNNNEAKDFIETSFKYFAELDDKNGMLKVLSQMATYYQFQGDYDQALELLEKHALICAELMDNKMLITNQYQRAMIYYWQGDFNKSGEYYLKAMKITEQINDIYQKACILHNVGLIHREQFNCDKAMEYFKASQKIFEDTGDKNGLSLFFGSVGGIYFQHEDCRTAIEFYKKELAIGIELGEKYLQYCALGDIGRAQIFQGNFSDGIKNLSKALEICEETGDKLGISINQNILGEANMEIGNLMKAEYCFDSAILLGNELKMNSFLPLYLYNKALLYFEMARYNEASLLNIETLKSACIPQHKRTIFGANILNSKLLFISGKKEEAIEKLKELLGKSTDPYETGILNSQLWKFLKQVEDIKESGQIRIDIENHQKIALEIFTELHAKTMGYEYKKRINEMVKI
jgi:tetratricopeptide (TPR) repeat protein